MDLFQTDHFFLVSANNPFTERLKSLPSYADPFSLLVVANSGISTYSSLIDSSYSKRALEVRGTITRSRSVTQDSVTLFFRIHFLEVKSKSTTRVEMVIELEL